MKLIFSYIFYFIGDIISRTTMRLGDGYGYSVYSKVMNLSVNLDVKNKVWKKVKK